MKKILKWFKRKKNESRKVNQLIIEDKNAAKLIRRFCKKYKMRRVVLIDLFENKMFIKLPNSVKRVQSGWLFLETGEKIKLNLEVNQDDFCHITVEENNIARGYDLYGFKILILIGRKWRCVFSKKRGYSIQFNDKLILKEDLLEGKYKKDISSGILDEILKSCEEVD